MITSHIISAASRPLSMTPSNVRYDGPSSTNLFLMFAVFVFIFYMLTSNKDDKKKKFS